MLKLNLVTPNKKLLVDYSVKELFVPGYEGELNILHGHAALMTTLTMGALKVVTPEGEDKIFALSWGYCEVSKDSVSILAETAESAKEIDTERAEDAYKRAQVRLEEAGLSVADIEISQRKLERAELRIAIAKSFRENN